jgi:hypothetical protein
VVIAAAVLGGAAPETDGIAIGEDVAIAADAGAGQAELDRGGSPLARPSAPTRQAPPPEREHGTDGIMGVLPIRALLAANAAAVNAPASTRTGAVRRNGGLGWQTDAYAE